MEWTGLAKELLSLVLWTVAPVALALVAELARAYANRIRSDLWRELALAVVSKIEAQAQGALTGDEKLALAMADLKRRGVPAERIRELIEWAVLELAERFDYAAQKREGKEVTEVG